MRTCLENTNRCSEQVGKAAACIGSGGVGGLLGIGCFFGPFCPGSGTPPAWLLYGATGMAAGCCGVALISCGLFNITGVIRNRYNLGQPVETNLVDPLLGERVPRYGATLGDESTTSIAHGTVVSYSQLPQMS